MIKKRAKDCPFCRRMRVLLIFTLVMAAGLMIMIQQQTPLSQ
jgi:hypothetical protein